MKKIVPEKISAPYAGEFKVGRKTIWFTLEPIYKHGEFKDDYFTLLLTNSCFVRYTDLGSFEPGRDEIYGRKKKREIVPLYRHANAPEEIKRILNPSGGMKVFRSAEKALAFAEAYFSEIFAGKKHKK